jgi:hypothetical protein
MIIPQPHGRRLPSVLLSVIRQDCYAKPVAWTQPSSPGSCTECAVEPFRLEQAMISQQAVSNDPLSPHAPSPLPADADANVTGTDMIYRRPPASTRRMALAAQAPHRHVSDAFPGVRIRKDLGTLTTLRRAKFDIGVRSSKDGNQLPGGGLCPLRRMSTLRSTRQDAQINYLSTLSIFMKQTTYLATLPNPKANECPCL